MTFPQPTKPHSDNNENGTLPLIMNSSSSQSLSTTTPNTPQNALGLNGLPVMQQGGQSFSPAAPLLSLPSTRSASVSADDGSRAVHPAAQNLPRKQQRLLSILDHALALVESDDHVPLDNDDDFDLLRLLGQ